MKSEYWDDQDKEAKDKNQEDWAVGVKCSKAIIRSEITRGLRVSENLLFIL